MRENGILENRVSHWCIRTKGRCCHRFIFSPDVTVPKDTILLLEVLLTPLGPPGTRSPPSLEDRQPVPRGGRPVTSHVSSP